MLHIIFFSTEVDVAEEAFFQGDSFVEVDKSLFPHVSSTAAETITVEFSTLEPNGILFWHGQKADTDGRGQDYVALTGSLFLFLFPHSNLFIIITCSRNNTQNTD